MKRYILNLLVFSSLLSAQTTYWVDGTNGNDSNNGTSESTAFKTVHKVIEGGYFSPNWVDTVKVKAGTYDFKDDEIFTSSSRNFVLIGVEGASKTIFDAGGSGRHITIDDALSGSTIQGITFQNGKAENWPGAGSIAITYGAKVDFIDCVWKNNSTTYSEGGGAIIIREGSTPSFTNCVFDSNHAVYTNSSTYGGAVRIQWANTKTQLETEIVFKRTKFLNNYVQSDYSAYGGAISSERALKIENCLFVKNYVKSHVDGTYHSGLGGAVYFDAIRWNGSSYEGGNMYIANSTFHGNYVQSMSEQWSWLYGAAISYGRWNQNHDSKSYLFNSVITGSRILIKDDDYSTSNTDQLKKYVIGAGYEDHYKLTADYSVIQAPRDGKGWGDYIYDVTPSYKDTANGDYSLADNSPLIGAAVATWSDESLTAPTEDLLGNARPSPSGSNPDMGAYENSLASSNAPMPVSGLVVVRATEGAKLSWSKIKESLGSSTDASNIEYQIYQDTSNVAQTTSTSYNVTGLTNGTTYKFSVSAKNTQTGSESALSPQISVTPRYQGPRWHVASSGGKALSDTSSNFDYGSYDSPINHLNNALDIAADGDTIIMMKGTHTGSNNRSVIFNKSQKLVISGDLKYSADQTIMDAGGKDRHFKFESGNSADSTFVIQHITLTNGSTQDDYGGGSISIRYGSPKLYKIIFKANLDSTDGWRSGGALNVYADGSVLVDSCVFDGNRVSRYSTNSTANEEYNNYAQGGAIGLTNTYSKSVVRNSTFRNNQAYAKRGASGSAIYMSSSAADIINNLFHGNHSRSSINNSSNYGSEGAIYYSGGPQTYSGNKWNGTTVYFVNNTVVNNLATSDYSGGWGMSGVYYCGHDNQYDNDPVLYAFNNIIYGNKENMGSGLVVEEYQLQLQCGKPIVRNDYNLIYNADQLKNGSTSNGSSYLNFDYTIDSDPGFADSTNGNYSLSDASLAIGAGVSDWTDWGVKGPTTDMLGGVRPNPSGSAPDLGAYENALAKSPYPKQVKNVTAVGGSGSVTLTWDALSEADLTYKVYKHTSAFNVSSTYYVGQTTTTTYTITGLDNATRYYFRVTAVNSNGYEGTASSTIDITPTFSGPVWWISTTGSDVNGEGSTGNPFKSIKHALDHVSDGDTIMVKPGTYTGSNNRDIEIRESAKKIQSLVLMSEKGPDQTIFDAERLGRHFSIYSNNSFSVDTTIQIIGLTFTKGFTNGSGGSFNLSGETYYSNSAQTEIHYGLSPKFVNCRFIDNQAINTQQSTSGGAIRIHNATPIFESCVFDSNAAVRGGALSIEGRWDAFSPDTMMVRNSTFKNNIATDSHSQNENWGGGGGGAIFFEFAQNTRIINSNFEQNSAIQTQQNTGGPSGGAIYAHQNWNGKYLPYILILNSRFTKNKVNSFGSNTNAHGGAMYLAVPSIIANTVIDSNLASFSGQNGSGMGGGLFLQGSTSWNSNNESNINNFAYLVNNTIVNNIASSNGWVGGIAITNGYDLDGTWFNNIIWGNRAIGLPNEEIPNERHNLTNYSAEEIEVTADYNNIEFYDEVYKNTWGGNNSYGMDPGFVGVSDFKLSEASPLIGLGTMTFNNFGTAPYDILNNQRPSPVGSNPDIGAYENALATSPYPKQVQNLTGMPGTGSVTLAWAANSETDIDKYYIYMSNTKGFIPSTEDFVGETADTTYVVTGLVNKTKYYFRVAAVDKDSYRGTYSREIEVMPEYLGPVWWISQMGNNTNDGDEFSPLSDLREAFKRVSSGDTIMIKNGVYTDDGFVGIRDQEVFQSENGSPYESMVLTIRGESGNPEDVVFDGSQGNGRQRFFEFSRRDEFEDKITIENITLKGEYHDGNDQHGSPGGGAIVFRGANTELVFKRVVFKDNTALQPTYHEGGGAVQIQVQKGKKPPVFIQCSFINNTIQAVDFGDGNQNAVGGAVSIVPGWNGFETESQKEHPVIFDQCYFENNKARSDYSDGTTGSAIQAHANIMIINSVFVNNILEKPNGISNQGWQSVVDLQPQYILDTSAQNWERASGRAVLINNTFHGNVAPKQISIMGSDVNKVIFGFYNNIIGYEKDYAAVMFHGSNVPIEVFRGSNLFSQSEDQYLDGASLILTVDADDYTGDPKYKGELVKNFQLKPNSPAIDEGIQSWPNEVTYGYNGDSSPIFDTRGYYRVGAPDIGAYEFGASKYLLKLADDVDTNFDTTFVKLGQEIKYTITTNDIEGNIVSSNESVSWNIFPNDKYVKYVSGDINTQGGDASAKFQVTSQARGKGFRFRIDVGVGDAFLRSPMYVVEELVTGAPPPVISLKVTPDSWSKSPDFKLEWATPEWAEKRDLIGAVIQISDEYNDYNEYLGFPTGDTLTSYEFKLPEPGTFDTEVWLVDEYGNEEQDSSQSATAYFDNIPPAEFQIMSPNSYESDTFYASNKPRFSWDNQRDYPSGIEKWDIYINDNLYGSYTRNEVTVDQFNDGIVYIEGSNELADGYYDWWAVAVDSAGNKTHSDTGYFGVDLSPPKITHSNPLTVIDENTTSPAINATFTDGASGVKIGRLHYRRAGTGAGFASEDLLSGPFNLPASDIKSVGVEYYIYTEDNIGNDGKWPENKAFQSVKVRTESGVSTSGNVSLVGGTDSTNYIFFSIPYDVGNGITEFKSVVDPENKGPDEFKYRLYAYNNGWQENPSSLTMGNGYFFIFDPDKFETPSIEFDFGIGVSTETDPPYQVNVAAGQWKFFGLPYDFNVSLSDIYTESGASLNDAGSIYTWNGSWVGVGSSLQPWKGYIFKSGGDSELNIDARGAMFGKVAESFDDDNVPMDANEWIIDIIAATGNTRDELNSVGVRHNAKDGYDRLDEFEPPTVPGNITLRIDNRDRELSPDIYAKDIRKPNENGHYWDLEVYTPTNGQRTYITFEGLGYIPQEYDVFIINKTNKQAKNLEWESTYRFANTGTESYLKQDLRLVIGTKQFVEDNNAGVDLYPDAFTLSQNYPNPFNPQTSIRLSLEEDANVDLIIYNLLGEEITRLAANEYRPSGYYNFIWNGRNAMGNKVSTGVYLYHAMVRDTNGKIVLNKTKKMIFLK